VNPGSIWLDELWASNAIDSRLAAGGGSETRGTRSAGHWPAGARATSPRRQGAGAPAAKVAALRSAMA